MNTTEVDYEALQMQQRALFGMDQGRIWLNKKTALDASLWLAYEGLKIQSGAIEIYKNEKKWDLLVKRG